MKKSSIIKDLLEHIMYRKILYYFLLQQWNKDSQEYELGL